MAVATSPARLHLGLRGDLQSIVDLDPEIPEVLSSFVCPSRS
jgi:hypothetical protein